MGPSGSKEKHMNRNGKKESSVTESQFKGKPVLALHRHAADKRPLRFGLVKAGLILSHVEEVEAFVAKHAAGGKKAA